MLNISHFSEAIAYQRWQLTHVLQKDEADLYGWKISKLKIVKTVIRSLEHLPQHIHLLLVGEGPLTENTSALRWNSIDICALLGFRKDVS